MQGNNYLVPLLAVYLKHYTGNPDRKELQLVLQSSPSFPSVLSIIQACSYFGLKTKGYKADFSGLLKSRLPVIAHIKKNETEQFVLVKEVTEKQVVYMDTTGYHIIKETTNCFCNQWTGIFISSEKGTELTHSSRKPYITNTITYGLFATILLFICLYGVEQKSFSTNICYGIGLSVLKIIGLWLATELIRHETGVFYSPSDRFCHLSTSFDCDKVLRSNAAKILNTISLADMGFIYFMTGLIALLSSVFSGSQSNTLLLLFYLSCCCIPYILFSVIYQKFIIKKWCPLCLGIMGTILLEIALFLICPNNIPQTNILHPLYLLIFSLMLTILTFRFHRRLLKAQTEEFINRIKNLQLKRTPAIFMTVFNRQTYTTISTQHCIHIGNPNSDIVITTLLNPMCIPCKKAVAAIMHLMKKFPLQFLWQIRFDGIEVKAYNAANRIQLHLLELCRNEKDDRVKLRLIEDWFKYQSFQWFSKKYSIKEISAETISNFKKQNEENKQLNAKKIPSIWLNGRDFPQEYTVSDLPFLCADKLFIQLITDNPDRKI